MGLELVNTVRNRHGVHSQDENVWLSGNQTLKNETYPGWWCNNHLETYEFVNFGRIIPYMKWKIKFHGSKPSISIEFEFIWKDNPLYWGIHCEGLESVNGLCPGQGDTDRSWQENHCVCVRQGWKSLSHPAPSKTLSGWWLTYPSEKWWSSSVGMMTFPTEWKVIKFHGSKPPTSWWQNVYGDGALSVHSWNHHWTKRATDATWLHRFHRKDMQRPSISL